MTMVSVAYHFVSTNMSMKFLLTAKTDVVSRNNMNKA